MSDMRMITGAILLLGAEQAFAHSQMIGFPNQLYAKQVLYPAAIVAGGLGVLILVWGLLVDSAVANTSNADKSATKSI